MNKNEDFYKFPDSGMGCGTTICVSIRQSDGDKNNGEDTPGQREEVGHADSRTNGGYVRGLSGAVLEGRA